MINDFHKPKYRFLSNFYHSPITYERLRYPTVEHAYQAAKVADQALRQPFTSFLLKPGQAKRLGRKLPIRPDWEEVKLNVMLDLLRLKFAHEQLAGALLATGEEELIEGNDWGDTFWGVCAGLGQNHLGRLLMQIRGELG